jgi:hypothetical protein
MDNVNGKYEWLLIIYNNIIILLFLLFLNYCNYVCIIYA